MTIVMPDESMLHAVAEQMWVAMLRREPMPWYAEWPAGVPGLAADLVVSGDWAARVVVWAPEPTAEDLARTLLSLQGLVEPDSEDVEDALGEIANVVAGQLKGALGGVSQLGLPQVAPAPAPALTADSIHLTMDWNGEPVLVSIAPA